MLKKKQAKPIQSASSRFLGKLDQKERDVLAYFSAITLFLASIEYLIPKPVPFMRLGLANLPILIALEFLPVPQLLLLVTLKVLGQGILRGTLFSYVFLFSAAGSFSSGIVMILLWKMAKKRITLVGISVSGALTSNMLQIILARFLIFGEGAWLIAPPFLLIGTVSSVLLGVFANRFVKKSLWLKKVISDRNKP